MNRSPDTETASGVSSAPGVMRYAVIGRTLPPGSAYASAATARLIIDDVPAGTSRGQVLAALERAGKIPRYTDGPEPFSGHDHPR